MSEGNKIDRFIDFITGSEREFYETYLVNLTEEELEQFLKDNPDFAERMRKEKE